MSESFKDSFKFRDKCYKHMKPLGYDIIWAENHPKPLEDAIHFTGNGLKYRIIYVKRFQEEHFYFIYEFPFNGEYHALKSRKYNAFSDLEKPIADMNAVVGLMPNNLLKKSFLDKIKILFKNKL